jgi:hypothetical protein
LDLTSKRLEVAASLKDLERRIAAFTEALAARRYDTNVGGSIGGHDVYTAAEANIPAPGFTFNSTFSLAANGGDPAPWSSAGLPIFSNATSSASGSFEISGSVVLYNITSLTPASPVPLPAAAWLMLSALSGFGAFTRKRRRG